MDSSEMEDLIKEAGWTLIRRARRKQGLIYIYASRREGSKVIERYIAPLSKIGELTPEQVISKLQITR